MPTWIAPKLPPPANTKAVLARPVGSSSDTRETPSSSRRIRRATFGSCYSSGGMGWATEEPVIPGRVQDANPESRDSGYDASHRSGMTVRVSALDERLLDHEMAGRVAAAFDEAAGFEHLLQFFQHPRAAA